MRVKLWPAGHWQEGWLPSAEAPAGSFSKVVFRPLLCAGGWTGALPAGGQWGSRGREAGPWAKAALERQAKAVRPKSKGLR